MNLVQVWLTHLQVGTDTAWRGKEVPLVRLRLKNSNSLHKDLNVSETRRRADKVCLEGQLHRMPLHHPAAESCQWLWKYARKSNWTARSFLYDPRPIQKELVWMVLFRQCEERLVLRRCIF